MIGIGSIQMEKSLKQASCEGLGRYALLRRIA